MKENKLAEEHEGPVSLKLSYHLYHENSKIIKLKKENKNPMANCTFLQSSYHSPRKLILSLL